MDEFLTAAFASKKLWPLQQDTHGSLSTATLTKATCHRIAWTHPNPDFHSDDEDHVSRKKLCNKKMIWRRLGTLGYNLKPAGFLASFCWFASDSSCGAGFRDSFSTRPSKPSKPSKVQGSKGAGGGGGPAEGEEAFKGEDEGFEAPFKPSKASKPSRARTKGLCPSLQRLRSFLQSL